MTVNKKVSIKVGVRTDNKGKAFRKRVEKHRNAKVMAKSSKKKNRK